ncbi:hypothetical protein A2961_00490 [Candidatus Woesebacteria bacterium RIFCSPLOWO2_01_FULL_39_21]|uniref:PIN domain-containing protein n=1 Tax=Candidatus Woesebacteria bacterium RIFCSPLOWO2_01_FULL_39_21 TaxID=1802519 RepID=A0A1F8BAV7_9BACT|nr:MAG: hypothetical protein A2691_00410 [Candidatus Woesebacteria bacterium RIFCSPHIGHO2_01_FULL_39_23]OGM61182.1 MAG: hypothetical protein A2961_00490 [Candidatus Woesebacteria bacterium RIFCSPLOWO2_01_FULL_39_21]
MAKRGRTLKTAFFDSSVLFSAVYSPTGGSSKLFTIKDLNLTTSRIVLAGVERNVRNKLESYHLGRFFRLVEKLKILDIEPNIKDISKAESVIVKKDAVILSQAKASRLDYLFTLDRKHFLNEKVEKFTEPIKVMTPKMYFQESNY